MASVGVIRGDELDRLDVGTMTETERVGDDWLVCYPSRRPAPSLPQPAQAKPAPPAPPPKKRFF